jgi:prophage regulatory protein
MHATLRREMQTLRKLENLILLPDLVQQLRLSSTTIWRMERAGRFPRRIRIGERRIAWRLSEVEA